MTRRIVISNGNGLFALRLAAAEMDRRGALLAFVTAGYPTACARRVWGATGLDRTGAVRRLLARGAEIAETRVHASWSSELFYQLGNLARRLPAVGKPLGDLLHRLSRACLARLASRTIDDIAAPAAGGVYHYRSGYGHSSIARAKARGFVTLCEHTIAHPAVLAHLVTHGGRLPPPGARGAVDANWRAIERDLEPADHVLANSDFVRRTFLHQGWPAARVHVIYRGLDDWFLDRLPAREGPPDGPLRLLFAGSLGPRKGGDTLVAALAVLDDVDWRLDICGGVEPGFAARARGLLADPRVTLHGVVDRATLARQMTAAEIFIFPTLAEGSARVIFEALAAGCFVVTTANAGSIVVDGEHGALVEPTPASLSAALRRAAADRDVLAAIGARNAALIRRDFRQSAYGDRLAALYQALAPERGPRNA